MMVTDDTLKTILLFRQELYTIDDIASIDAKWNDEIWNEDEESEHWYIITLKNDIRVGLYALEDEHFLWCQSRSIRLNDVYKDILALCEHRIEDVYVSLIEQIENKQV